MLSEQGIDLVAEYYRIVAQEMERVASSMSTPESNEVLNILKQWDEEHSLPGYDPVPHLTRLAETIEAETEAYMKKDPDPFDERHPSRAYPNSTLGYALKILFRKEQFMTKLVNDYLRDNYYSRQGIKKEDVRKLNIASCRLMLDITPGLETSAVFEMPTNALLVHRLFAWAEKSPEPLRTYATGLLATAMEVQEIAVLFREKNNFMVPLMLERLRALKGEEAEEKVNHINSRPFAHLGNSENESSKQSSDKPGPSRSSIENKVTTTPTKNSSIFDKSDEGRNLKPTMGVFMNGLKKDSEESPSDNRRSSCDEIMSPPLKSLFNTSDCSNSSWVEMESFVIGHIQMHPLTLATRQLFILKYLTPMGEYQEFLSYIFEKNAMELCLHFMNLREIKNARLSFEALKYLASLLCHKKFSIEFINVGGLQSLLAVPRPSIAATGVSICLYYLSYCEDAMERVCLLPQKILSDLVGYSLWLLECSHDSGRCHATMFFGLSFQFRVILEEFDAQDGLRKLYNVISTLPILASDDTADSVNEDEECSARQIVRHVCVALKHYFESHLYIKAEQIKRAQYRDTSETPKLNILPSYKACKSSPEDIKDQLDILLEYMPFRAQWSPVDNLLRLGGIKLLLQVISYAYEWNFSGKVETVQSALDVIRICSVMYKVQLALCSSVDIPDDKNAVGINVILQAAEGEIVPDANVQRAALLVIITCVCAPIHRLGSVNRIPPGMSLKKRLQMKSSEEVIEKVWDCFRTTNGIMILLNLIQTKMPITDADSIRGLACQALAGIARSETVRQIISKLPLFTSEQLQNLMKDPILQDRRQEHVAFQKYALELLERVSGKRKPTNELEPSLTNIHKANVVAQTRIQFNDRDLLQLIQQHLLSHGLTESAEVLQREANLPQIKPQSHQMSLFLSPFTYEQRVVTPTRSRPQPKTSLDSTSKSHSGPIKLNFNSSESNAVIQKKTDVNMSTPISGRSLEKKIYYYQPSEISQRPKEPTVTLDSIITEYLTNQHALCKNPMSTCPQFTLFEPHKCPDPKTRNTIPTNFTMRHSKGIRSNRLDQKLLHSKFLCIHIFRYGDDNAFFTCCDFYGSDNYVVIGSHQGEIKLFNLHTGSEVSSFQCHDSYISQVECSPKNNLLLSSSTWRRPLSACWSLRDLKFEKMFVMEDEDYVEFSKLDGEFIIGTRSSDASIYDVNTGQLVSKLTPVISNQYTKNKATFSPSDELVLSDGVLWDVNSGKEIHKFDKLNQTLSGVFHPNGLEVVSNTEVWDLRTFHLLRTVPCLDQSEVTFSPPGSVIYSVTVEREVEEDSAFENSFKTLDAYDYSSIATIDVKKSIYDLACNKMDTQIAIVENQGMFETVQESVVKIYDIGRVRTTDEEREEVEEEEEEMATNGSNSDDDQQNDTLEMLEEQLGIDSDRSDNDGQDNSDDDGDTDYMEIELGDEYYSDSDSDV